MRSILTGVCCWFALVTLVLFVLTHFRVSYDEAVQMAMKRCTTLALESPDIELDADEIDCELIHHDVVMRLRIAPDSDFEVSCLLTDKLLGAGIPRDCVIHKAS